MSLVGTRPPTVDEWDKYELHHRARLATKPGLTGMWQVSGRSNITVVCIQTGKRTRCILRRTWNRLCYLYGRKLKDERNQLHSLRSICSR